MGQKAGKFQTWDSQLSSSYGVTLPIWLILSLQSLQTQSGCHMAKAPIIDHSVGLSISQGHQVNKDSYQQDIPRA